ncbi:hypothetical protein [Fodinibius sp.]|uniref:hypothetical protein n=1 Tax=Fodinibius sp. TaxID=1872440 RepID=UPI002ACDAECB|nr:hypothetical protein [Fodinibius sp.]MDZ7660218.1 hypothetical protein [Fodinibius sp.]
MIWATLLLICVSGYVAAKFFSLTNKRGRLKFLGLTIAAAIFTVMQFSVFLDYLMVDSNVTSASEFIVEWGHVISLSFVLSSLAIFIRESKPVFAQFPMIYTALPLLIIISYILVQDTYAIKTWLIIIYQGGAIIVALLMYSVYTYRRTKYAFILGGVILFLISYILYWGVSEIQDSFQWIWKLLVGFAMTLSIFGYQQTEKEIDVNTI